MGRSGVGDDLGALRGLDQCTAYNLFELGCPRIQCLALLLGERCAVVDRGNWVKPLSVRLFRDVIQDARVDILVNPEFREMS
jgi:hypothetical protein